MSEQVFRYDNVEDFLNPRKKGTPASIKFDSLEEAMKVRDLIRQEDPEHYYNIHHYTSCCVITTENINP